MQDSELRDMVSRIIVKRRLRVDNFNDFLQEVRIRIMKYGLDYCNEGRSDMDCVAAHVKYTHMSYKQRSRAKHKVFTHQLIDSADPNAYHLCSNHDEFEQVDAVDEVEHLHDLIKDEVFTERERQAFYVLAANPYATFAEVGEKLVPPAPRGGAYMIIQSLKRKMEKLCLPSLLR
jgi:hypothetical protein